MVLFRNYKPSLLYSQVLSLRSLCFFTLIECRRRSAA